MVIISRPLLGHPCHYVEWFTFSCFYLRFYDKTKANLCFLPSVFLPMFFEVVLEAVEAVTVKNECGTVPKTELLYSLAAFFDTMIDYTTP